MQRNFQVTIIKVQQGADYGQEISHIQDRLFDETPWVVWFEMLFFNSEFAGYGSFPRRFKMLGWASKVEIDYKNSFKQMISFNFVIW